jgi:hypothetical protein
MNCVCPRCIYKVCQTLHKNGWALRRKQTPGNWPSLNRYVTWQQGDVSLTSGDVSIASLVGGTNTRCEGRRARYGSVWMRSWRKVDGAVVTLRSITGYLLHWQKFPCFSSGYPCEYCYSTVKYVTTASDNQSATRHNVRSVHDLKTFYGRDSQTVGPPPWGELFVLWGGGVVCMRDIFILNEICAQDFFLSTFLGWYMKPALFSKLNLTKVHVKLEKCVIN